MLRSRALSASLLAIMVMGNHTTDRYARATMVLTYEVASDAASSGSADTTLRKYWASYQRQACGDLFGS